MQVKNVGNRGWFVGDKLIAPNCTEDVAATEADIAGNDELEVVKKVGRPAAAKVAEPE